jgi:hypothetical protein
MPKCGDQFPVSTVECKYETQAITLLLYRSNNAVYGYTVIGPLLTFKRQQRERQKEFCLAKKELH